MTKRAVCSLVVAAAVYASAMVVVSAQAAKSVNEGVYSEAQAKRGEAIYKEQCAACHGDNLEGSGPMPPLAGKDFLTNWQGKAGGGRVREDRRRRCRQPHPDRCRPSRPPTSIAYMLSVGKYPAGAADLPAQGRRAEADHARRAQVIGRICYDPKVVLADGVLRRRPLAVRSSVAQRQSIRLLTGGLLVRIQPEEPIFSMGYGGDLSFAKISRRPVEHVSRANDWRAAGPGHDRLERGSAVSRGRTPAQRGGQRAGRTPVHPPVAPTRSRN